MHKGRCFCSTAQYEVHGEPGPAIYCHCPRCRKANGPTFTTNASLAASDLVGVAGVSALKTFSTPAGLPRVFCRECGSPIVSRRDTVPDLVRLCRGTLDTPLGTADR